MLVIASKIVQVVYRETCHKTFPYLSLGGTMAQLGVDFTTFIELHRTLVAVLGNIAIWNCFSVGHCPILK